MQKPMVSALKNVAWTRDVLTLSVIVCKKEMPTEPYRILSRNWYNRNGKEFYGNEIESTQQNWKYVCINIKHDEHMWADFIEKDFHRTRRMKHVIQLFFFSLFLFREERVFAQEKSVLFFSIWFSQRCMWLQLHANNP